MPILNTEIKVISLIYIIDFHVSQRVCKLTKKNYISPTDKATAKPPNVPENAQTLGYSDLFGVM